MPTIKVNNINLYYQQHGQGPDLVMVAGLSAPHTTWLKILDALSQHFRVTIFDNRGVGESGIPETPYTIADMAQDVIGLMDHLNIEKAYVYGHSMGGFIMQHLLQHHADRITKAIVSCASVFPDPGYELHKQVQTELTKLAIPPELLIRNNLPFLFGKGFLSEADRVNEFVQLVMTRPAQPPAGFNGQIAAIKAFARQQLKFESINLPVLALGCSEDRIATPESAKFIAGKIPNAQCHIIENCGHIPHLEKPDVLMQVLMDFYLG